MTWLLVLYPPRWRRRYGREFVALVESQRFSFTTFLDIVGGAIDAWTSPQSHLAVSTSAQPEGGTIMLARQMRLRCAGFGEKPTLADALKGAGVILGGTLISVLAALWMRQQAVDPLYTEPLMTSGWLFAYVLSMPYTALKGWPRRTQAIFVGLLLAVLASIVFGASWIVGG